jgi:hypothetical protein
MPSTFDLSVESPATVDQILSAFGDGEYWRARLAMFGGGTATLTSLIIDASGAVTVAITLGLLRDRLPKLVTQLHRGDLEMVRNENWSRIGGGRVRGDIDVAVPGAPLSAVGQALLVPEGSGSRMTYSATVAVKVPFVGGKIENFMGGQTIDEITKLQRFTTQWIAERH